MDPRFISPIPIRIKDSLIKAIDGDSNILPTTDAASSLLYPTTYGAATVNVDIRIIIHLMSKIESVIVHSEKFDGISQMSTDEFISTCRHLLYGDDGTITAHSLRSVLDYCEGLSINVDHTTLIRTMPMFVVDTTRFDFDDTQEPIQELRRKTNDLLIMVNLLFANDSAVSIDQVFITFTAYRAVMMYIKQAILQNCASDGLVIPEDVASTLRLLDL